MKKDCSKFSALSQYLISIRDCNERREALIRNGLSPELVAQYFQATDLRGCDNAELIQNFVHSQFEAHYKFTMSNAQIGCAISHREVARSFSTRTGNLALVLEDDIVPTSENFEACIEDVAKVFQEHAHAGASFIVHLGVAPHWHKRVLHRSVTTHAFNDNLPKLFLHSDPTVGLWYAHAYLLSKAAAVRIAEREEKLISNVDDWLYRRQVGLIDQIFYTQPLVFKQDDALESLLEADRQGERTNKTSHEEASMNNARFNKSLQEWPSALAHRVSYSFHRIRSAIPYRLPPTEKL